MAGHKSGAWKETTWKSMRQRRLSSGRVFLIFLVALAVTLLTSIRESFTQDSHLSGPCQHHADNLPLLLYNNRTQLAAHDDDDSSSTIEKDTTGDISEMAPPIMFIGIFTIMPKVERRQLIRDTMLNRTDVCPYLRYETHSSVSSCSVIYAFVLGSASPGINHTEWRSELAGFKADDSAIARTQSQVAIDYPLTINDTMTDDLLFLNVKENMNHGKTPTWFEYASRHFSEPFDFVVKTDDDTLIDLDYMLDMLRQEAPLKRLVYGGKLHDFTACGGPMARRCNPIKRKVYMGGQLFWMSRRLAKYISDPVLRFNNSWPFTRNEDADISFKVWSFTKEPVHVMVTNNAQFWRHALKKTEKWNKAFAGLKPRNWTIGTW